MRTLPELFENNRRWATQRRAADPAFFERMAPGQAPPYLWIGCSDSRVPANEVVGLGPGELFVHRNVANLVSASDPSCMAVVEYGVSALGVEHLIVCGHDRCGGVLAALDGNAPEAVRDWLRPVRDVLTEHRGAIDPAADLDTAWARLVALNAIEQAARLCRTPVVQRAWSAGRTLWVHAWLYSLSDGRLRDLGMTAGRPEEVEELRRGAIIDALG